NCELQSLVSTLSAGPVGPGDRVGMTNRSLVMRTCRSDGMLLKPDRPATPIDASFLSDGRNGEVWETSSEVGGQTWRYAVAMQSRHGFKLRPADIGLAGRYLLYHPASGGAWEGDMAHPLHLWSTYRGKKSVAFAYFVLAPLWQGGWSFLGEPDKFVAVSRERFTKIRED